MIQKIILLVEDNPDDEALTLRALKKNNIFNEVTVVHDGQEALDYFFGEGASERPAPTVVLLDLKLPKIDGLEVLRRIRAEPRTRLQPIVILTSSKEEQDIVIQSFTRSGSVCTSCCCGSAVRLPGSMPDRSYIPFVMK